MLKKKAFVATEALVAFVVFSLMVMLYLPGFYQGITRAKAAQVESDHWKVFKDLVEISISSSGESRSYRIDLAIDYYNSGADDEIVYFDFSETNCEIAFSSGDTYQVSLQGVSYE